MTQILELSYILRPSSYRTTQYISNIIYLKKLYYEKQRFNLLLSNENEYRLLISKKLKVYKYRQ